jgi:hypothetical protein
MKIKICKYCKKPFHPNKYSPHQICCNHAVCRRAREAERQKKYYRKKIKNPDWRARLSERKKQERFQRSERISCNESLPPNLIAPVSLPPDYDPLIFGMLRSINGARTYEELMEFRERCIQIGLEISNPSAVCTTQGEKFS